MNISIVIPTLNEEEMIGPTLRAIRERSCGHVEEIIVADGGSVDNTVFVAGREGATSVVRVSQRGRARQMNEGAAQASSKLLYFLHADSLPPHHFDRHIVNAYNNGSPAGCFRLAFDDNHPLLTFYAWCTRFDLDAFRFGDQSLYISKKLFNDIGGFNPDLIVMEDNMMVRKIKESGDFDIIPKNIVTSARKYRKVGILRLQLIFILIYTLFFLGFSQDSLVRTYKKLT